MEYVSSLNTAISTVMRLREISEKVKNAEFRGLLADLQLQLADAKIENAALKEEVGGLKQEVKKLQEKKAEREPFKVHWGCYLFENDEHLYCPKCYEEKGKKHITNRVNSRVRVCGVCNNTIPSG